MFNSVHGPLASMASGRCNGPAGVHFMLYELFMFWVVGSIVLVAASMVLGGLLCVWCAFRGRRRARLVSNYARNPSLP